MRDDRLLFAPIGAMRLNLHRPLPEGASIKSRSRIAPSRRPAVTGGSPWPPTSRSRPNIRGPDNAVGIDVGVTHLAATSDGELFENVRSFRKQRKKLRRAARALARCKRASGRRRKVRAGLARVQRGIANFRTTHLHRVSAERARRFALIGVENLKLKNMTRSAQGTVAEPGTTSGKRPD